ncbi:MAG: right-handed parallel beta-helix repeat-containing protein [Candidatus Cloacimonetes bacterium]|nr:right-handed parallel beta-helix repeat-containing protein [Candidatus Cloacimonadota bacterium]
MKKMFLFILFISIPIILICQTDWTLLNSGTTQDLNSVDFFDENNGLVAGVNGLILRTIDGGNSWISIISGTSNNLNGISFVNADTAVVVGDGPIILRTTDGGASWVVITVGVYSNLISIDIDIIGNGIAGGTDQTILKTDDAGATWSITQTGYMGGGWQGAQMVNGSIGFVFGSNSIFQPFVGKTTNSGTSFSFYNFYFVQGAVSYEGKLYDGYFFDDFNGITAGRRWDGYGCISSTSDLNNWTTQHFPTSFYGIDFSTETDGYVVGDNGTILHTTDGGTVWEAEDSSVFSQLNSVLFVNEDLGFIAGNGGVILRKQENTIYVSGDVSGIWSADTVKVIGDLTITDGEALTIDPGTYIEFQDLYGFNIQGCLLAVGTEQDTIIFTAIDTWHGIQFNETPTTNDSSKIVYCKLHYVSPDNTSRGAATISNFSKLLISHCLISDNDLEYISGGGISCANSSPVIEFNIIKNNSSAIGGGMFCNFNSHPIIRNNIIINNSGLLAGGGIICRNSSNPIIINNIISENSGGITGGGINCSSNSSPLIINNLINNNSATFSIFPPRGGGIYLDESNAIIINNTVTANLCITGGGLYCINSNPIIMNSIFWDNGQNNIFIGSNSNPVITYSDIQGGYTGEGNIDIDPLFWGTGEYPYFLLDDSPCVNVGTPDTTGLNLPEFDLAGNPRVFGGRIDMGAYENQNVVVGAEDNSELKISNFKLSNYPNPFNPSTTIYFSLNTENTEGTELIIYNIKGQKVKHLVSNQFPAGQHSIIWNGTDNNGKSVSSGIYFYEMNCGDYTSVKKMILMK